MTSIGSITLFGPAHSNRCGSAQLGSAFQRGFNQPQALKNADRTGSCTGIRWHVSTMQLQTCHAAGENTQNSCSRLFWRSAFCCNTVVLPSAAGQLAQEVSSQDRQHMQHALSLAKKALGKTFPNPAVGCVIVKQGKVASKHRTSLHTISHSIICRHVK